MQESIFGGSNRVDFKQIQRRERPSRCSDKAKERLAMSSLYFDKLQRCFSLYCMWQSGSTWSCFWWSRNFGRKERGRSEKGRGAKRARYHQSIHRELKSQRFLHLEHSSRLLSHPYCSSFRHQDQIQTHRPQSQILLNFLLKRQRLFRPNHPQTTLIRSSNRPITNLS